MDVCSKMYYKVDNLLNVTVNDREYSFCRWILEVNECK
jgi:hypothetical protein